MDRYGLQGKVADDKVINSKGGNKFMTVNDMSAASE